MQAWFSDCSHDIMNGLQRVDGICPHIKTPTHAILMYFKGEKKIPRLKFKDSAPQEMYFFFRIYPLLPSLQLYTRHRVIDKRLKSSNCVSVQSGEKQLPVVCPFFFPPAVRLFAVNVTWETEWQNNDNFFWGWAISPNWMSRMCADWTICALASWFPARLCQ